MPERNSQASLIVFGGLPGTGKTTIARELALRTGAMHLRIDTIEQAIRNAGLGFAIGDEGYRVAYAVAEDNLALGHAVIADSVNPLPITREAWRGIASKSGARCLEVEVVCSDPREHRRRVETRGTDVEGLELPSWQAVADREYHAWPEADVVVDTASQTPDQCVAAIERALGR